jgi:hypothetical protein
MLQFYANRLLSDYIDDNSVVKFVIKVVSFHVIVKDDYSFSVQI